MRAPYLAIFALIFLASLSGEALAKGCERLGQDGSYAKNLEKRKGSGDDKVCGQNCKKEVGSKKDKLKQQLEACKKSVGEYGGIDISGFEKIEKRAKDAEQTHGKVIQDNQRLCGRYGEFRDLVDGRAARIQSKELTHEQAFKESAAIDKESNIAYDMFNKEAKQNNENIDKTLKGNQKDGDPEMKRNLAQFKQQLYNQTQYMKDQAKKKLAERQRDAADPMIAAANPTGPVRFKTQADVDKFYKGMQQCNAAIDGLDDFGKKYEKLSKDVANAKEENQQAEKFFQDTGKKFGALDKKNNGRDSGMESIAPGSSAVSPLSQQGNKGTYGSDAANRAAAEDRARAAGGFAPAAPRAPAAAQAAPAPAASSPKFQTQSVPAASFNQTRPAEFNGWQEFKNQLGTQKR